MLDFSPKHEHAQEQRYRGYDERTDPWNDNAKRSRRGGRYHQDRRHGYLSRKTEFGGVQRVFPNNAELHCRMTMRRLRHVSLVDITNV